ncbi:hypothetical protein GCM10009850_044760 [Nonomuraea monospora]|uniref:Uncharacterized protein n=1 Tax=Nonomuraea monospora TaxID=568818 RepID=A0ABN3CHZ0_9ACTN
MADDDVHAVGDEQCGGFQADAGGAAMLNEMPVAEVSLAGESKHCSADLHPVDDHATTADPEAFRARTPPPTVVVMTRRGIPSHAETTAVPPGTARSQRPICRARSLEHLS